MLSQHVKSMWIAYELVSKRGRFPNVSSKMQDSDCTLSNLWVLT